MLKNQQFITHIEQFASDPDELLKCLLYFEGCLHVYDLPKCSDLLEKMSVALLKIYDHITPQFFGRITQALVATGKKVDSESLRAFLTKYI